MAQTIEHLMNNAETYGISHTITLDALEGLNPIAIEYLFQNLEDEYESYVLYLCQKARQVEKDTAYYALLSALQTLKVDIDIIDTLRELDEKRAIPILHQILDWVRESYYIQAASRAIISLEYNGDSIAGLQDESFPLRKYIAQQLEKQRNTDELINALSNSAPKVRQIAAWYLGRTKAFKAKEVLQSQRQQETDVEAKRAIEWALDILEKYADS